MFSLAVLHLGIFRFAIFFFFWRCDYVFSCCFSVHPSQLCWWVFFSQPPRMGLFLVYSSLLVSMWLCGRLHFLYQSREPWLVHSENVNAALCVLERWGEAARSNKSCENRAQSPAGLPQLGDGHNSHFRGTQINHRAAWIHLSDRNPLCWASSCTCSCFHSSQISLWGVPGPASSDKSTHKYKYLIVLAAPGCQLGMDQQNQQHWECSVQSAAPGGEMNPSAAAQVFQSALLNAAADTLQRRTWSYYLKYGTLQIACLNPILFWYPRQSGASAN